LVSKGEQYEKEYAVAEREIIDQSRKARNEGGFYVPAEAKLIIVTRIRGYSYSLISKSDMPLTSGQINLETFAFETIAQRCLDQSQQSHYRDAQKG
jgi:Ribosomal L30 N-terminal domain